MTTANNAPISFRLTEEELELLRQHQEDGEKSLNLTAKRLLLNTLGVDAKKPSIQVVNSVDMVQVQELIETAVQEKLEKLTIVDNVDILKKLIDESLADGGIGEAIAKNYEAMMGQFNGLLEELQELKKQFEELQSNPPAAVPQSPINEQLTTDNGELLIVNNQLPEQGTGNREQGTGEHEDVDLADSDLTSDTQSPITDEEQAEKNKQSHEEYVQKYLTPKPEKRRLDPAIYTRNYQIVSMLECQFWMDGKKFNNQELKDNGIDKNLADNKAEIESMLGIEVNSKDKIIQRLAKILRAMGFELKGNQSDGFYIVNPELFN
jgi:hypothetical protein